MLIKKCWFDLKTRFLWIMVVSLCWVAFISRNYFHLIKLNRSGALNAKNMAAINLVTDYPSFVNIGFFIMGLALFAFLTWILALGGMLAQKNRSVLHMTLSLPLRRSHWLMGHAGMTAFLVLILIYIYTFSFLIIAYFGGKYYPLGTAMINALLLWLHCLPWIGLSLLANSFFHSGFKSMMFLFIFLLILFKMHLPEFLFFHNGIAELKDVITWKIFLVIVITTIGTTGLAIWKFNRNEY